MKFPIRPSLLKDKTECLLNLKCELDFATDAEVRDRIKKVYFAELLVYPDVDMQAYMLQAKADTLKHYYNELYKISIIDYNPIENYNRYEEMENEVHSKSKSSSNGKYSEFPMDSNSSKDVNATLSGGSGNTDGTSNGKAHIHGTIGSIQNIMKQEIEIKKMLGDLLDAYVAEFKDLFMITI